jgi:cytochrome oxidase assembly protein ShyY1
MTAARARGGLLLPGAAALAGLVVLLGLGTWQVERKAWKEALIETLNRRLVAEPQPLPPAPRRHELDPSADEFTRVRFAAAFRTGRRLDDPEREARVYTGGSSLRSDIKAPGYFVFAPARLVDGSTVVVNRGYVANPRPTASTAPAPLPPGPVDVIGMIRFPEQPGWFDQAYSAADDLWFVRDPAAMAARNGWGPVAPFYIDMEGPVPPAGTPLPAPLKVNLRNDHLQYAITWYGLAAVLVVMFVLWSVRQRREPR